ncbi:hypothetical protein L3Q82_026648 [Scortum barcoo]|uniref:Uncharacterized protein n=1 Tax=Scortum barcoo TaxID=214431 RepID=A0ACB8WJ17_9TELE|nr:hypothetical protein L3Q82_026648 [Scortum barcoo]
MCHSRPPCSSPCSPPGGGGGGEGGGESLSASAGWSDWGRCTHSNSRGGGTILKSQSRSGEPALSSSIGPSSRQSRRWSPAKPRLAAARRCEEISAMPLNWSAQVVINMAPVMEGTHTVLLLYAPIRERSSISLYFPKRRARNFKYKSRAPHSERASNDHDWGKEDLAMSEQRGQSSDSSGELLSSQQATKEAVPELCWLVAEHHQLLADLLSLCRVCANKVRMGNQDGKLQDYMEGQEVHPTGQVLSSSDSSLTVPPENKKVASMSKKLRKLGGKKLDSAEDFLHNKMKKKVSSGALSVEPAAHSSVSLSSAPVMDQISAVPVTLHASDSPVTSSHVSAVSNPILPMEEPFQISREGWDFMEDNRTFDPDMDFCSDFLRVRRRAGL